MLSSSEADAANVLAAVHQGSDALTAIANGHWLTITTAIRADRLYVLTRVAARAVQLPAPLRPDATRTRQGLAGTYMAAARSSAAAAADSLSTMVLAAGGPSRHIALARHAIRRDNSPGFQAMAPSVAKDGSAARPAPGAAPGGPRCRQHRPGPARRRHRQGRRQPHRRGRTPDPNRTCALLPQAAEADDAQEREAAIFVVILTGVCHGLSPSCGAGWGRSDLEPGRSSDTASSEGRRTVAKASRRLGPRSTSGGNPSTTALCRRLHHEPHKSPSQGCS
jgi:hypothetical protein